jgi:hypothetical protein
MTHLNNSRLQANQQACQVRRQEPGHGDVEKTHIAKNGETYCHCKDKKGKRHWKPPGNAVSRPA